MYREETKANGDSRNKNFFKVLGLFGIIFLAVMISNYFRNALGIFYTEYVIFALAAFLCAVTMHGTVLRFAYTVNNNTLLFYRIWGKREKLLVNVKINELTFYGEYASHPEGKYLTDKVMKGSKKEAKCFIYSQDKKKHLVVFLPSERLEQIILSNMRKSAEDGEVS